MARRDLDDLAEAEVTAGAAFDRAPARGPRQVTPPSVPADLQAALAMPDQFGTKFFETAALQALAAACPVKVKDAGHLLLLRDWLFQ